MKSANNGRPNRKTKTFFYRTCEQATVNININDIQVQCKQPEAKTRI